MISLLGSESWLSRVPKMLLILMNPTVRAHISPELQALFNPAWSQAVYHKVSTSWDAIGVRKLSIPFRNWNIQELPDLFLILIHLDFRFHASPEALIDFLLQGVNLKCSTFQFGWSQWVSSVHWNSHGSEKPGSAFSLDGSQCFDSFFFSNILA